MARADKLAAEGQTEQALREYLWALDHGLEVDPGFTGVRNTILIRKIIELGTAEQSALRELEARAARLEEAILTSRGAPVATFDDVMLYVALNRERNDQERTLRVYQLLRQRGSALADDLYDLDVSDRLLEQRKYAELLEREDWWNSKLELNEKIVAVSVTAFRAHAIDFFESLAGAKRNEDAMAVLARVEARDVSAKSFVTFMERAVRPGNAELAVLVLRRGRERVPTGEQSVLTNAARELNLE
jgi:hypothetical protein